MNFWWIFFPMNFIIDIDEIICSFNCRIILKIHLFLGSSELIYSTMPRLSTMKLNCLPTTKAYVYLCVPLLVFLIPYLWHTKGKKFVSRTYDEIFHFHDVPLPYGEKCVRVYMQICSKWPFSLYMYSNEMKGRLGVSVSRQAADGFMISVSLRVLLNCHLMRLYVYSCDIQD